VSSTGPSRPRAGLAAALVVAALVAVGCSVDQGDDAAAEQVTTPTPATTPATDEQGELISPSTLPDPGVLGGTCGAVTYTPPTAVEAFGAELCRPPGAEARDVGIVLVHGGGGIGGDRTGMTAWAEAYVAAGYTTLSIDYLLFDPGVESPVFPRPEQNVKAAVQYLRGIGPGLGLDPDRILIHGQSAGARLGAVAFTTAGDDRFEDGELWVGVDQRVNGLIGFYSTYDGTMQYDDQYYGGSRDDADPEVRANWVAADSIVNAGEDGAINGPAAFFTGELDWSELAVQQDELAERVRDAGYIATSYVHPFGEHGYDAGTSGLTEGGQAAAFAITAWLDGQFPQS
jgi:acetyl esterase/lipase